MVGLMWHWPGNSFPILDLLGHPYTVLHALGPSSSCSPHLAPKTKSNPDAGEDRQGED